MRTLLRNARPLQLFKLVGTEPVYDAYGNDTLEVKKLYDEPIELRVNISAASGQDAVEAFGNMTNYSRTIALCGNCVFSEGDRVAFGGKKYDVVKVADSKNGYLVAISEVPENG